MVQSVIVGYDAKMIHSEFSKTVSFEIMCGSRYLLDLCLMLGDGLILNKRTLKMGDSNGAALDHCEVSLML